MHISIYTGVLVVSPKRHADVHELCVATEDIPGCMELQKDHVTAC